MPAGLIAERLADHTTVMATSILSDRAGFSKCVPMRRTDGTAASCSLRGVAVSSRALCRIWISTDHAIEPETWAPATSTDCMLTQNLPVTHEKGLQK